MAIERLAHAAEDLLDDSRRSALDTRSVDVLFEVVDTLRSLASEVDAAVPAGVWQPGRIDDTANLEDVIRRALQEPGPSPAERTELDPPEADVPPTPSVGRGSDDTTDAGGLYVFDAPLPEQGTFPGPAGAATGPTAEPERTPSIAPRPASRTHEAVRVDGGRLDRLADMISELVITQNALSEVLRLTRPEGSVASAWDEHITQLDKITREVQELASSLRMVPVRPVFRKMARLARDVAKKSGKQVNLTMVGEDTELDKDLVDRIGDPLVHLVRNAIDHGIESTSQARAAAGKAPTGNVQLSASHRGGSIHVHVSDDGCGLDRDAIIHRAAARGLIDPSVGLDDDQVYQLICEPGFSTAAEVTEISGRGVGMDVVRRSVQDIGGRLEISSHRGSGTTVTMVLPLTLAVIDGLVVEIAGERLVVPVLDVVRVVAPLPNDITSIPDAGEVVAVEEQLVPILPVADILLLQASSRRDLILIAEANERPVAIPIDRIVDQYPLVIKNLGFVAGDGFGGCAILPDGEVGLVVDTAGLVGLAAKRHEAGSPSWPAGHRDAEPSVGLTGSK